MKQSKKGRPSPIEASINRVIASSKPAPKAIQAEVHEALERLGALFSIDKALIDALKSGLSVRLLTAESPDFYVFRPGCRPERVILLNFAKSDSHINVHPAAVHEECAHALRGLFHPRENPMIQEFIGALGPVLALDKAQRPGRPSFGIAGAYVEMMQARGEDLRNIPDGLAASLKQYLPPDILAEAESKGGNERIAAGFLEHSARHMLPGILAQSMADTGYLEELMAGNSLISLPAKEIADLLNEYGRRCATDPEWREKFKDFKKVYGYYVKPG